MKLEFTCEQLVNSFTKKYIEDVSHKTYNELFVIFDLINKEYKEINKCPICEDEQNKNAGRYLYNNTRIVCGAGIFFIGDDVINFAMKANYCPICGREIS